MLQIIAHLITRKQWHFINFYGIVNYIIFFKIHINRGGKMKKGRNDLVQFLIGIIMLASGLYWFMSSVTVRTGFIVLV